MDNDKRLKRMYKRKIKKTINSVDDIRMLIYLNTFINEKIKKGL